MARKLSPKQRLVLAFIGSDVKTKAEIVDQFSHWYYCNESKHVGDVLTRLVRAGWLTRPMRGHYAAPKAIRPAVDNNQIGLFSPDNKTT